MTSWLGRMSGILAPLPDASLLAGVQQLTARLRAATTPDERCRVVKTLRTHAHSRATHEELGKAIPELVDVLKLERSNLDAVCDALETLYLICKPVPPEENEGAAGYVELYNAGQFVEEEGYVGVLLALLEEKESYVRLNTAQLLTTLIQQKASTLQEYILRAQMGVSRLMDLLVDHRESVRNEGLLLLTHLAHSNQEIQKIVAFEGAFEKLFFVIDAEGAAEGGIVVQDALNLMNALIAGNVSNQNYFRETSCIQRLPPLLRLGQTDQWFLTEERAAILLLALDTISLLVSAHNPNTSTNQTAIRKHGLLDLVMHLALSRINSPAVRSRALRTLGNVMKDSSDNRNAFMSKVVETEDGGQKQPALHRLLVILLNSRDVSERLGSLYAFKSYLHENEEGQIALASTLRPSPIADGDEDSVESFSIGRRLLHGLIVEGALNGDGFSGWFAGCVLSYIVADSPTCKKLMLDIPLEIPRSDQPIVSLLAKIGHAIIDVYTSPKGDTLVLVALLRLLCMWVHDYSPAVKAFFQNAKHLPFLVELVMAENGNVHVQGLGALLVGLCFQVDDHDEGQGASSAINTSSLHLIITRDIGTAKFMSRLDGFRKSEAFLFAEQDKPVLIYDEEADISNRERLLDKILYDYDFTLFFKDAYDRILRKIRSPHATPSKAPGSGRGNKSAQDAGGSNGGNGGRGGQQYEAVLQSYKDLIRSQDQEMALLKKQISELQQYARHQQSQQPGSPLLGGGAGAPAQNGYPTIGADAQARIAELEGLLRSKTGEVDNLTQLVNSQRQDLLAAQTAAQELNSLAQAYNELEDVLRSRDADIDFLKQQVAHKPAAQLGPEAQAEEQRRQEWADGLIKRNQDLEHQLGGLQQQLHQQQQYIQSQQIQMQQLQQQLHQHQSQQPPRSGGAPPPVDGAKVAQLQNELREEKARYESLEEEQEELLIALAKIEIENNNLKERLAQLEQPTAL